MEYEYKGTVYKGETPMEVVDKIMASSAPELTEEEAKAMTFAVFKGAGVSLRLWPSRCQRLEELRGELMDAYADGSEQDAETARKEMARLKGMTDADWDKEQEDYLLNGYSDAELLAQAKEQKLAEIAAYDTSTAVNGFKLNGNAFWLDKATRVGLMNSTTIAKGMGNATTDLWLGEVKLTIDCDKVIRLLGGIEMYALECFNVTARHKAEVQKLKTVKEVEAYDVTEGYPKQLEINLDGLDRQ